MSDLELMVTVRLNPMREQQLVSNKTLFSIFGNIETLIPLHKWLLSNFEGFPWPNAVDQIGGLIEHFAEFLRIYQAFVVGYSIVDKTLEQQMKESDNFRQFLNDTRHIEDYVCEISFVSQYRASGSTPCYYEN